MDGFGEDDLDEAVIEGASPRARRRVSRSGNEENVGCLAQGSPGTPKKTTVLEDCVFAEAVARRLDRVLSPPPSNANPGGHVGSHPLTPRTPTRDGPGSNRKSQSRSARKLSRQMSGLGLREPHDHRNPRSLFSPQILDTLLHQGRPYCSNNVVPMSLALDNSKESMKEPQRPFTVDTGSVAVLRGRNPKDWGGPFALARPGSAIATDLMSGTSMSWSDDDMEDQNSNNDPTRLSRFPSNLHASDYGEGRKGMCKSSSTPGLIRPSLRKADEAGDPIISAKRSKALASFSNRQCRPTGNVGPKNVLVVATNGNSCKPADEALAYQGLDLGRASTAPGTKRRRALSDHVAPLVGFSTDQFALDSIGATRRHSAGPIGVGIVLDPLGSSLGSSLGSGSGSWRLSPSPSMPSLLRSRTFNFFNTGSGQSRNEF